MSWVIYESYEEIALIQLSNLLLSELASQVITASSLRLQFLDYFLCSDLYYVIELKLIWICSDFTKESSVMSGELTDFEFLKLYQYFLH